MSHTKNDLKLFRFIVTNRPDSARAVSRDAGISSPVSPGLACES